MDTRRDLQNILNLLIAVEDVADDLINGLDDCKEDELTDVDNMLGFARKTRVQLRECDYRIKEIIKQLSVMAEEIVGED